MQIIFENTTLNLNDEINLIFSSSNTNKKELFNSLSDCFNGKNKNFIVNGKHIEKNEYNVIYYNEETDFVNEFSFTKSNVLHSLIYDSIIKSINTDRILEDVNNIFNKIDIKINSLIDKKINKNYDDKLKMDINITSVESIINKYTDIYINDYLISNNNLSKVQKRMLIYQTLIYRLNSSSKNNIVIIDDFDVYLDASDAIKILNKFKKIKNTIFILSSINNIYEYIDEEISVFKYAYDNFIEFNNINNIIKEYFDLNNYNLMNDDDINRFYNDFYISSKNKIGNLLTSDEIYILKKYPKNINKRCIIYGNKEELKFLIFIGEKLLTRILNYDTFSLH